MHRNKHYDQLAEAVRHATAVLTDDVTAAAGGMTPAATRRVIGEFVDNMADWLAVLNGRFDTGRFLDAAGLPHGKAPDPRAQAMADWYATGASLAEVGAQFGISGPAVAGKLRAAGVPIRRGGPLKGQPRPERKPPPDAATVQTMVGQYTAGATLTEVGAMFGYHASTVADHLRGAGVQIRGKGSRR